MNVLWISHFVPYPPKGGNLQRSYHLLRVLSREASVDLLAYHRGASLAARDLTGAERELRRLCRDVSIHPIPNERSRLRFTAGLARNLFERDPYTVRELRSPGFERRLGDWAARRPYDLVHFDTIDLARYRDALPDRPAVLGHHNVESLLFERRAPYEKNPLAGAYLRLQAGKLDRFERAWYERFTVNLFVSEADRSRARAQVPGLPARVVPNGVDVEYYRPGPEGEENRAVWVGGLRWFPNRDAVDWMLREIWPRVRRAHPDALLDLIGEAPGATPSGPGRDGVVRHGFVDDIRPLVRRARVFVVPIRVGGGTRLKILDAMAMGKAIVSTSAGAEGIDARFGKEIVHTDAPEEFAAAVGGLFGDPERRHALGEAARRLAEERYAWEAVGERFLRHVRSAAEGRPLEKEGPLEA